MQLTIYEHMKLIYSVMKTPDDESKLAVCYAKYQFRQPFSYICFENMLVCGQLNDYHLLVLFTPLV